jgi:hypothetical protein
MPADGSPELVSLLSRIDARISELLDIVVSQRAIKDWYTNEEFAALVNRTPFTTREWCRHGRVRAEKRRSGRGKHCAWVVSHDELLRYQREGLLPEH